MERSIVKTEIANDKDGDVPDFGGFANHELRYSDLRPDQPDLLGVNAVYGLKESALKRALYFGHGLGSRPRVHFPNAEHFQHIPFAHRHWETYGEMESEDSRIRFMLASYPSRRFPAEFEPALRDIGNENPLIGWSNQAHRLDRVSKAVYERVLVQMEQAKVHDGYSNGERGAYQSEPVFYQSSDALKDLEINLWQASLGQIIEELEDGNDRNIPAFLNLYNRLKDPITPLKSSLSEQSRIFKELLKEAKVLSPHCNSRLISQLALESSFLALPGASDIDCVIYGGHHELPYINVDINNLPRAEFANPNRVIEVMAEIIRESNHFGKAVITPITVSYYQESGQPRPNLFIVDGNNRATAVLVMQYLNFVGFENDEAIIDKQNLVRFILLHDLDIEWERDLAVAIKALAEDLEKLNYLAANQSIIKEFANAQIPALLVQEPNFHTVAVAQSEGDKIILLQPMHQAIYNQGRFSLAIPSKQQSHGRAAGNDVRLSVGRKS